MFKALVIQYAKRMRRIILSPVACPPVQHFFYTVSLTVLFSQKKKKLLNIIKCVPLFSLQQSEMFLKIRKTRRDIVINVHWSGCKVPVILVRLYFKIEIPLHIFEKFSNIKFH